MYALIVGLFYRVKCVHDLISLPAEVYNHLFSSSIPVLHPGEQLLQQQLTNKLVVATKCGKGNYYCVSFAERLLTAAAAVLSHLPVYHTAAATSTVLPIMIP